MATTFEPIELSEPGTESWHDDRMSGIGASEAAAVLGVSTYATPLDIYCRKLRLIPDVEDNDAMRLGRKLEPVVVSEFTERTGIKVKRYPVPLHRHPEYPFMLATPDAILETDDPLEAKTMNWRIARNLGVEGSDEIPFEYLCQTQQQMAVMGRDKCHVAILIDGRTLQTHVVNRHDGIIAKLIEAERELWERIQNKDAPEPNFDHARTADLIKEMHGISEGEVIELPEEIANLWRDSALLGKEMTALEAKQKVLKSRCLHAIGDAQIAVFPSAEFQLVRSQITVGPAMREGYSFTKLSSRKVR